MPQSHNSTTFICLTGLRLPPTILHVSADGKLYNYSLQQKSDKKEKQDPISQEPLSSYIKIIFT